MHTETRTNQDIKQTCAYVAEAKAIVDEYLGSVLSEKIGEMKTKPVKLQYEEGFRPTQPQRYPVPVH